MEMEKSKTKTTTGQLQIGTLRNNFKMAAERRRRAMRSHRVSPEEKILYQLEELCGEENILPPSETIARKGKASKAKPDIIARNESLKGKQEAKQP